MVKRRNFLQMLAGVPASLASSGNPGLLWHYRAKATVLMLSVPLFSRDGVGGGYLRVEETEDDGGKRVRLEFAAGSVPERAAGLSRLGMFEETVNEQDGEFAAASYFGFMSSSPEQSLDQARTALNQEGTSSITAVRGKIDGGRVMNRLFRLSGLPRARWGGHQELLRQVRQRVDSDPGKETRIDDSARAPGTFLYALRSAIGCAAANGERWFVHNGELLALRTAVRAAAPNAAAPREMTGRICNRAGKEISAFTLWFDPSAACPAPVKFEFRARSFLRLSFERSAET